MRTAGILAGLWVAACLAGLTASGAEKPKGPPEGVIINTYNGWENSVRLSSANSNVQAVVVSQAGGRIIHYSLNGENVIYEVAASAGKTVQNTPANFSIGGHQCDLGPEIRGIPNHFKTLWMGIYQPQVLRDFTAKVTSEIDPGLGMQTEKEITIDPDTGDLGLTQRMKNMADREASFCMWDRTLVRGGGFALIPLSKKSKFPAKWGSGTRQGPGWVYETKKPSSARVRILDNVLVAHAGGDEQVKVGADSDAGWMGYASGKVLLVKYFPVYPKGNYTDGGHSVELYYNAQFAELEPLSPEVKLKLNQSYEFPEKWTLIALEEEVLTHEQARALVKRVPPSPFKH